MKRFMRFGAPLWLLLVAAVGCKNDDTLPPEPPLPPAAPELHVGPTATIPASGGTVTLDYTISDPTGGGISESL